MSIQNKIKAFLSSENFDWPICLILILATLLRIFGIGTWSLWQDEETSIFFSKNIGMAFPQAFPIFFLILDGVFQLVGISYWVGRGLAGFFGIASIWLSYIFLKKYVSRDVGLVAAIFLAVSLGHIFWSQSIRYYTCVLAIQMVILLLFYSGLEEGRYWKLFIAGLFFNLAMLTHFSTLLLAPVLVGYLLLIHLTEEVPATYNWKSYFIVGLPILMGLVIFLPRLLTLRSEGALGTIPQTLDVLSLLIRIVGYYGAPMVFFAVLSLFWIIKSPSRGYCLMLSIAIVPILELIVIRVLGLAIGLWSHGFVSIMGVSALAAIMLVKTYQAGFRKIILYASLGTIFYYGVFLSLYYSSMHGDRPRWSEASMFYSEANKQVKEGPVQIFATVPAVVAHYLGLNPAQTMVQKLIKKIPPHPSLNNVSTAEWHLARQDQVSEEYEKWYRNFCELKARFPAYTGWKNDGRFENLFIDRSVSVYFCPSISLLKK